MLAGQQRHNIAAWVLRVRRQGIGKSVGIGGVKTIPGLLAGRGLSVFDGPVSFEDPPDAARPFAPHYEEHLRPRVADFEVERVAALRRARSRLFKSLPGAAAIVLMAGLLLTLNIQPQFIFAGAVIAIIGLWIWTHKPIADFKSSIKEQIYPHIFRFFGDDFVYRQNGPLSISSLESSGIIPSHDNAYTEDYVHGSYRRVELELTEAKLTETRGSGKNRRTVTVFRGIFITFSVNKNFAGRTIVRKDRGAIGNWFTDKFNKMENVTLEDPEFERRFEVYASDQVEARYMLTPSFMQRLLDLSAVLQGSKLQCSFYDDKLLLMVASNHDRFETASIFEPATFVPEINTVLKEMSLIFQIVDVLKLDQRTGL